MSESDDEVKSQDGDEEAERNKIPLVWKFAGEDKVGPIHKHLAALEDEEFTNAIKELNPANGQPLLMWATLRQRFVLVEWLLGRGKREAFAFSSQQHLDIYDKFVEKRKERAEREAEKAAERAERAAAGEEEPEEEEPEEPEPEIWQEVKNDVGEEVEENVVKMIGELGVYEGGRDAANNRHGLGKALFVNGDLYIGEYKNNKREGIGLYYWAKDRHIYIGEWRDNQRWGIGRMIYNSRSGEKEEEEEEEEVAENAPPKSKFKPDGGKYYGSWERNLRHGHGRYTYPSGDTYDGQWLLDVKEGEGTYTFNSDSSKFQGSWRGGSFINGRWILASGAVYYGSFENNPDTVPVGKGVYVMNGGKFKQEGEYKDGKWIPRKVDNLSPDNPCDFLINVQGQELLLQFTPEGAALDTAGIASLINVVNFQPFKQWIGALESQDTITVKDIRIRCIDREKNGDITGVRLKVEAFVADKRIPMSDVYLQSAWHVLLVILIHDNQQYVLTINKPNFAISDGKGCPQLPRAREDTIAVFGGEDIQRLRKVTGLALQVPQMFDITGSLFGTYPPPPLFTSPASSTASIRVWLYKQQLHPDRYAKLLQRIQYYKDSEFVSVELHPLDKLSAVRDVPSLAAVTLLNSLGDRVPSQTVPPERPPTPPPPEPEPLPVYTEAELAMQRAMLEAEQRASKRQQEEQQQEEEGQEDE